MPLAVYFVIRLVWPTNSKPTGLEPITFRLLAGVLPLSAKKEKHPLFSECLERITGLEPATSTLARWRSTKWAKSASIKFAAIRAEYGLPEWRLGWGSNPRPLAWQASALTNWATKPNRYMTRYCKSGGKYMGSADASICAGFADAKSAVRLTPKGSSRHNRYWTLSHI